MERAAGRIRLRLVVPRRGAGHDAAAVRRRQRARSALPPGDHRPGHRDARADVSRTVLGGARIGRGLQRAGHRRGLAAQGGARPAPHRMRRRHPAAAGRARRSATTAWCRSTAAGCGRCPTPSPTWSVRRSLRRDRGPPRRVGRRPDHRQPTEGDAAEGPRRLPRGRRSRPGPAADPPQLGARRRRSRWRSPTTSGAATSSVRRSAGTSRRSRPSTSSASDVSPEQVKQSVRVSSDLGQHAAWLQEYLEQGWDELYLHFVGKTQARLHRRVRRARAAAARRRRRRASGDSHESDATPATCGGRTPSSTARTSRRSTTGTATAPATSAA